MLPLRILVRSNTDWRRLDRATFALQSEPTIPLHLIKFAAEHDLLSLWDAVFPLDFFEYRARLQHISKESFVRACPTAISYGFDDFDEWFDGTDEEIIVPTDDDDFFSPKLPEIVSAFGPDTNIVVWPFSRFGYLYEGPKRACQIHVMLLLNSNNWAIRKSYLKRHFNRDTVIRMLAHHPTANEAVADQLDLPDWTPTFMGLRMLFHPSMRLLEGHYSLYNMHPGSIYFLQLILRSDNPIESLRQLDLETPVYLPKQVRDVEAYVRAAESAWKAEVP
jgi:hypothetical protein